MKKNKVVLPLIIILLLCFLPCSIYGIYNQIVLQKEHGNPNHLHKYDGKLFFYDSADKLIGIYNCQTESCDDALTTVDDEYLDIYENGSLTNVGIFGSEYAFIQDGNIKLHNIKTDISIAEYSLIKNYGVIFDNGGIIVKDLSGNYGLFNMNTIAFDITPKYQFMGIANNHDGATLPTDRIAILDNGEWFVISLDDQKLSAASAYPIYDYDKTYIYHISPDGNYYIYMYDGTSVLPGVDIKKIDTENGIHVLQDASGRVVIYDYQYIEVIKEYVEFGKKFDYKIEENKINIYDGDNKIDSYDIENGE